MATAIILLQNASLVQSGHLEIISPPSGLKLENLQHTKVPKGSGY